MTRGLRVAGYAAAFLYLALAVMRVYLGDVAGFERGLVISIGLLFLVETVDSQQRR
jgi:hypothetical protein